MPKMLEWKRNLKAVMDNPDYIEQNISAIQKELKKDNPDTCYLRSKVKNINTWVGEIDLAKQRAIQRQKLKMVT